MNLEAILNVVGPLCGVVVGVLITYFLGTRSEKRQREKEFIESARKQLFGGNRVLRAEVEAWIGNASSLSEKP